MRRRDYDDDLDQPKRSSPYQDLHEQDEDGYDDYDDYEDDDMMHEPSGRKSTVRKKSSRSASTRMKLLSVVIVLLVIVLIALVIVKFALGSKKAPITVPSPTDTPQAEQTTSPSSIVFAPISQATNAPTADTVYTDEPDLSGYGDDNAYNGDEGFGDEATEEPVVETPEPVIQNTVAPVIATSAPTAEPQPTGTPLPIILTNTPTPTPEPTATPTPSPTPEPTATPTPSPTPVADLATGTVNRDANLRANAASNAKVKKTIKKGESVTIHETKLDSTNKVWYYLTVDDTNDEGWMRDYVVTTADGLTKPTATPKAEAASATPTPAAAETESSAANEEIIATGKTNREANLRKVMNGKVITQLKKNKTVEIYEILKDKKGNTWYRVKPQGSSTEGYVRDYVITLDGSVSGGTSGTSTGTTSAEQPNLLDRDVIGRALTNRAANVREKPLSNATVVRQLSNGTKLQILAKYAGVKEETWYEVVTESGKTYGFVRDYVINVTKLDKNAPTLTYEQ